MFLVDWEGYIANPAMKYFINPPIDSSFPTTARISVTEPRIYFDLPSEVGDTGSSKIVMFANASVKIPISLSIFPDRNAMDEDHLLLIQFTDASGRQTSETINIHVIDQDQQRPASFEITVDFSKDQTGFFDDAEVRGIFEQAADDWAYFIDDMNLDSVPAGAEKTWIWDPDGFKSGSIHLNDGSYEGYLLYAYGIHHDELRAGGEVSIAGDFQSSQGATLPIKRSGGVEFEIEGNFNTFGWFLTKEDDDWWESGNFADEPHDFYSIAHHEIGHALFFHPSNSKWAHYKEMGEIDDAEVSDYLGHNPVINTFDHLQGDGGQLEVDPVSQRGAYGNEYYPHARDGGMPPGRWLPTKLDLLAAQALGYKLRTTSPFIPITGLVEDFPQGSVSVPFTHVLRVTGGIPPYHWRVLSGELPPGLLLDSFTGTISGTPTKTGTFDANVGVREYVAGSEGSFMPVSIAISP